MIKLFISNSILFVVLFLTDYFFQIHTKWWVVFFFFFIMSLVTFQIKLVMLWRKLLMVQVSIVTTAIRLFGSIFFVFYLQQKGINESKNFNILFVCTYFFHLMFEIYFLLTNLRPQNKGTRN